MPNLARTAASDRAAAASTGRDHVPSASARPRRVVRDPRSAPGDHRIALGRPFIAARATSSFVDPWWRHRYVLRERARHHASRSDAVAHRSSHGPVGAHGAGAILKLRSTAGAECVSAPTETKSAPVAAISGIRASVTPPDTSTCARPFARRPPPRATRDPCCRPGCAWRPRRARRRVRPACVPRPRRSCPRRPRACGAGPRPRHRPGAMWLSLIRSRHRARSGGGATTGADRVLSSTRSVGVVLRVSSTMSDEPRPRRRTVASWWRCPTGVA